MANVNSFVADELENKINILRIALKQAHNIINKLDSENKSLKDVFNSLTSSCNEDYITSCEIKDGSIISI